MVKFVSMNKSGSLSINETSVPSLEVGAALIKTLYSEVCGTDVHLSHQQLDGVPYPIIPGHVSTGIVEKINGQILDINSESIEVGDVVTFLDVHETCNSCWYCLVAKETTRCPKRKVYGITYSSDEGLLGGAKLLIEELEQSISEGSGYDKLVDHIQLINELVKAKSSNSEARTKLSTSIVDLTNALFPIKTKKPAKKTTKKVGKKPTKKTPKKSTKKVTKKKKKTTKK